MAAIAVISPAKGDAGVVLQSSQAGPHDGTAVSGSVTDARGAAVPFAPVTFAGSAGVRFSAVPGTAAAPFTTDGDDDLVPSVSGTTTAKGALPPVYAFFTRAGFNRITISAGGIWRSVTIIAPNSSDPYRVSVGGVAGNPGARQVVMGTVLDAFGNPVPGVTSGLVLTVTDPRLGTLSTTAPATDMSGMFSTAFRASDVRRGRAGLVIALAGRYANPMPDPAWFALAGVTLRSGRYRGTATITISGRVRFFATPSLPSRAKARLRGTAEPGSVVDIYAKPFGLDHSTKIASVMANRDGNWGLGTTIATTTRFRARTGTVRTSVLTTVVRSVHGLPG